MIKNYLKFGLLIISLSLHSLSYGQINWSQYSPWNTGDNALGTDGVIKIEKLGDTLVFMSKLGISFKMGNQWIASDAHLSNLEHIVDFEFASNGNLYLAAASWGAFEIQGPNYIHNRNTSFLYDKNNSILPSDSSITAAEEGPNAKIWFGTFGAGIIIKDGSTWSRITSGNSGLVNDTIYDIEYHSNKMFIATHRGLSIYTSTTNSWTSIQNYSSGVNGLWNPHVLDLFFDRDDSLWISTYWGASKWDNDTSFNTLLQSDGLLDNAIAEITQDTLGNIWFLHKESIKGLSMYDGINFTTYPASGTIGGIPHSDISCFEFDSQNNLWIGTDIHGAMKFNGSTWQIFDLSYAQSQPYIGSVGFDTQGNLWSGSAVAAGYYYQMSHLYSKYQNGQWSTSTPTTNNNVAISTICYNQFLDNNGRHWFSSQEKGLFYEQNGVFHQFDTLNSNFPDKRSDKFYQGKNGDVFVSTQKGLVKFDNNLNMTVYTSSNSGIAHTRVWDVAVDSSGNVWAATFNGLSKYNGSTWTTYDTLDYGVKGNTGYENSVYRVEVDAQQNIWIVLFSKGIVKFDGTNWTHFSTLNSALSDNSNRDLYTDYNGSLWALPQNGGINKYTNGKWVSYKDTIHLAAPTSYIGDIAIMSITDDGIGNYYLGTWGYGVIKMSLCSGLHNSITIIGDSSFCTNDSTILQANNNPNLLYEWYRNGVLLANETHSNITIYSSGDYYSLITDTLYWCSKKSNIQHIEVNSNNFGISFTSNDTIMNSPPFNATIINQTPALVNYSFYWEFGDGASSTYYHPSHQYQYNGVYDIKLTATHNITGCIEELQKDSFITATGGANCNLNATITPSGTKIICENDSLLLHANTGSNYAYQWARNGIIIQGADSSFYFAKQVGHYAVLISNGNCTAISQPFVLNHYPSNNPQIIGIGSLTPCTTDSMQLTLNSFYQNYQWSNGDTSTSIWINQTGYYYVDVVDQFGCNFTSPQFQISNSFIQPPAICIVGVDSATGKNRVIWERQATNLIDSIVVFRETNTTNVYKRIGSTPYSQSGIYVDNAANPSIRAWRYKLAAVDTCGSLSLFSLLHKTIHLTINAGLNGAWNLIWDNYVGFNVSSYFIYRGTSTKNMQLIAQIPGNLSSFTDLNPPSGTVYYQLEIVKAGGCYPDSLFTKANTNYHTSRSNHANNGGLVPVFFTADFGANITTGSWPIKINFTDLSIGDPNKWSWNFGDGNTSNLQNPSHTYNNSGQFTVSLKVNNGIYHDSIQKVGYIIVSLLGDVTFHSATELTVFPNPSNGRFTLDLKTSGSKTFNLRVFNMLGEQVYARKVDIINETLLNIDLSTLSKGVYFIRLDNKYESINSKIIID